MHRLSRPALYTQPLYCGRSLSFRHCPSPCTHQTPAADYSPYSPGNPIKHPSAHLSPNQCLCARAPLNPPMQILYYIHQLSGTLPPGISSDKSDCRAYHALRCAVYHLGLHTHFSFYLTICASDPLRYRFCPCQTPWHKHLQAAHQAPPMTYLKQLSQSSSCGGFRQAPAHLPLKMHSACVHSLQVPPQTHLRGKHTAGAYAPGPHPTAPRSLSRAHKIPSLSDCGNPPHCHSASAQSPPQDCDTHHNPTAPVSGARAPLYTHAPDSHNPALSQPVPFL